MTMTFSLQGNFEEFAGTGRLEIDSSAARQMRKKDEKIYLFEEQLRIPVLDDYIPRPRLDRLVESSLNKIGALLITGRSGAGKTALIANFAGNYKTAVWYRAEAADSNWQRFSSYLFEGIYKKTLIRHDENVSVFTEKLLGAAGFKSKLPDLIVLDDLHNVFDAPWFDEFFTTALYSLSPQTHLIFLSRSKPGCPLWRLRSKQILAVIDEKMLVFDRAEAGNLCEQRGISPLKTDDFLSYSFGRIGKLKSLIDADLR